MDESALAERLNRLEGGLRSLQEASRAQKPSDPVTTKFQKICQFALRNWILLSFVVAMLTAVYVKFAFGVDYLREYRSIKTKHDLSDLYTRMGDILMGRVELEAAEDAYRSAQQINPDNVAATRGMVKAEVFKPPAGDKYYIPEVVDAKLDYLLSLYPDDDQLLFLKGTRFEDQGDEKEAITWYQKALAKNPKSLGAYSGLGFHYLGRKYFDIDLAIKNLEKAVELDPYFPVANLNLGYSYILIFNSDEALQHLNKSYQTSPKWSAAYSLGEAYRYAGKPGEATKWHQFALRGLTDSNSEKDPFIEQAVSTWNYMPLSRQDRETFKYIVTTYSMEEKKAFTSYALSLDLALENEFDKANQAFEAAVSLDKDHKYFTYFAYAQRSIENLCTPNADAKQWFAIHKAELSRAGR